MLSRNIGAMWFPCFIIISTPLRLRSSLSNRKNRVSNQKDLGDQESLKSDKLCYISSRTITMNKNNTCRGNAGVPKSY